MKISRKSCLKSGVRRASVVIETNMAENEIERLSENESDLEDDMDSVSVSSAEPDNLEDVERLANEIFREREDEDHEFHRFHNDARRTRKITDDAAQNEGRFRLQNAGEHFPERREGKDHKCVVCLAKKAILKNRNPQQKLLEVSRTVFRCCSNLCKRGGKDTYLCIVNKDGSTCFKDNHTKAEFRLQNAGEHFPERGGGKDHKCVVCLAKKAILKKRNPQQKPPEVSRAVFKCCSNLCKHGRRDTYLCIEASGTIFICKDYHTKVEFWR